MRTLSAEACARYRGTTVLVLGASGFVGGHVTRALLAGGAAVVAVTRDRRIASMGWESRRTEQLTWVDVDLSDDAAVDRLCRDAGASLILNVAGYGIRRSEVDEALAWSINAELPARLVRAVKSLPARSLRWDGVRLLQVGSGAEYGSVSERLLESTAAVPQSVYGRSKLAGTEQVLGAPFATGVARLFNVYGPGEHAGRLLPTLCAARAHDETVPLSEGRQSLDFSHVADVALALVELACLPVERSWLVHVASGVLHTVREFAETAADVLGIARGRLAFGAIPPRSLETTYAGVSVEVLRARLGWVPDGDLRSGIRRTMVELDASS